MTSCVALAFASPFLAVLVALAGWWVAKRWWHPVADEQLHDSKHVWSRILPHVFVGGAVALGLLTVLYGGCGVFAHCCWESQFCGAAWKSPPWALVSGVAVAPALILLWHWRTVQRGKDQQQRDRELEQHERELAHQSLLANSSRFADAVRLLSGKGFERLGGVYALEQIAEDSPDSYRRIVVKTLCTYVRERERDTFPGAAASGSEALLASVRVASGGEPLDFSCAFLEDAELPKVSLHRAILSSASLSGTNLAYANLEAAQLTTANLSKASLLCANLRYANLQRADLSAAELMNADLRETCFISANLSGANLTRAKLHGAVLGNCNCDGANFTEAVYNRHTRLPFEPSKHQMVLDPEPQD